MAEPAAQPDGQYPRLNASLLHSHKFVGKIISLVGCVESFDGAIVSLRCADGPIVPVNAQQAEFNHPTGTFVELVGFVNDDNSVTVRGNFLIPCWSVSFFNSSLTFMYGSFFLLLLSSLSRGSCPMISTWTFTIN
jgi:hypothetical protein